MMPSQTRDALLAYNGAMILFSLMFAAGKLLSEHLSTVEIVFFRNFLSFLPILGFIVWRQEWQAFSVQQPLLLFIRGLLGTVGMGFTFYAYDLLPLPTVTTILFTASLWLIPLSILILHEKIKGPRLIAALLGFTGVLIMSRPQEDGILFGLIIALIASFFHATISIILRQLGKTENPITIAVSFLGIGSVLSLVLLPWTELHVRLTDLPLLIALGVTGATGQYLLSLAYKGAEAQTLGPFNYLNLIWSSILAYILWGDMMDFYGWLGASLIIGSSLYVVVHERRRSRKFVAAE